MDTDSISIQDKIEQIRYPLREHDVVRGTTRDMRE